MKVIGFLSEMNHDLIEKHDNILHVDFNKIEELVRENTYLKTKINELESQLLTARVM